MAINSLNASSYGLSGLVSGIDTQSMVEKMLSGTQSKIDKKNQEKTVLQMKQQLYRDVAAKLKALQTSYLSFTSGTNLKSSTFYNTMSAVLGTASGVNPAFTVSASTNATAGSYTMNSISQLATARTYRTNTNTSGDVNLNLDEAAASRLLDAYSGADASMYIKVGNEDDGYKEIFIGSAPETFAGMAPADVAKEINDRLQAAGVKASASFVNNKLQIKAENSDHYITVSGNTSANASDPDLAMLMFGTGTTNLSGKGTFSAAIDTDNYMPGFEVNLDGRTQTIRVGFDSLKALVAGGAGASDALRDELATKLKNAFGSGVKLDTSGGQWKLVSGSPSQKFTVQGETGVMELLGTKSGASNKLNTTMQLRDLNFATPLQGNKHTFTINGVQFSYSSTATIGDIVSDINASKAGVKVTYLESEDRFVIQNSETGSGTRELELSQQEGNLLSSLFGVGGSKTTVSYGVQTDMVGGPVDVSEFKEGGVFSFNMNGNVYKFNVKPKSGTQLTAEKLAEALNDSFADSFGVKSDGTQNIEFLYDNGKFVIRSNDKDYNITTLAKNSSSNTSQLGFSTGRTTLVEDGDVTLEEAGINFGTTGSITLNVGGSTVTLNASDLAPNTTMDELATKLTTALGGAGTVSFDTTTGAFRLTSADGNTDEITISVDAGSDGEGLDRLFGQNSISVNQAGLVGNVEDLLSDEGRNAVFKLNGNTYERASNTFTIDGLTFSLTSTTFKDSVDPDQIRTDYETQHGTAADIRADLESQGKTEEEILAALAAHEENILAALGAASNHNSTSVTVTRDTDKIVDGIVEFIEQYNETMNFLNGMLKADATYKDYAPLTSEQKKEMTDKEIELWEEKSKEGLLRNDTYLQKMVNSMRSIMFSKPEGSSIAIYDLGISTSTFYATNDGNLVIGSMDDLRSKIEADPEAVAELFAGTNGLMEQLDNAISEATRSSYSSPGYLTQVAGSSTLDTSSTIYKQLKDMDEQLVSLENKYWSEYNRYWKQFNTMEQLIQQMNTQVSWLSQLGG